MFSRLSLITFLVLCSILMSAPAHSATPIYSWQDASGVITFSDNSANAPSGAQIKVLSEDSDPQPLSETDSIEAAAAEIPERPSHVATEGELAIQLAQELGLGNPSSAKEAADILTSVRIAPQLGRWELDQPMTPELTVRLRTLTVAAAKRGWITITPEQALLAFDTAAALLDAPIPAAPETPEFPYPIVEAPPVVYLYPPPPEIYPYYIWEPVVGGFWWNDFLFPGFFALNVDLFFFNHHHHRFFFGDRLLAVNSFGIQRHFLGRIADHRFGRRIPGIPHLGRAPSGVRSAPISNRMINSPIRLQQGLRPSGVHQSGIQPQRRSGFQRSPAARPMIRRQSSPFNSITPRMMARSAFPASSVRHFGSSAFSRPQSSFLGAGHFAGSASHGFNTGMRGGGFGHATGRGSSFRR